jgi:signal transduction histidine kinase
LDTSERTLQLRTRLVDRHMVEIAVIDAGCGIPPADLEAIFAPFRTTKRDGMGLGLAVCRTIMDSHGGRHGGHLSAVNNDAGGACVQARLPGLGGAEVESGG